MRKNKLKLKTTLDEYDPNGEPTGETMVLQADIVGNDLANNKTKSDIAFMISSWLSTAEDHFEFNEEERFQGEAMDKQKVVNEMRKMTAMIAQGEYKVSEMITLANINPESTLRGNITIVFNIKRGISDG